MDLIPRKFYLDDIFDDFLTTKKGQTMKCDIYEKDGNYHIEMDVPGFSKEDISVEAKDGYLTISAEKKNEVNEENEKKNYIRRERVYGKYERSFYVGDLDQDKIDAEFNNGCLKITVPKKEEVENKKVIEIK
ncbi:MAG: Hsp20/alpha crystallin family protein [Bacilli bacterium]